MDVKKMMKALKARGVSPNSVPALQPFMLRKKVKGQPTIKNKKANA